MLSENVEMHSTNVPSNNQVNAEEERAAFLGDWEEIFSKLDTKDGAADRQIQKYILMDWIDTLNFQDTIILETRHGMDREKIRGLLEQADKDRNGYIDRVEFESLLAEHSAQLEKIHQSRFLTYLRVAAYAQEYRWCPPALLVVSVSLVQVALYLSIKYLEGANTTAALIYNPKKRYEAWRWFSYSLLHGDNIHLSVNLILQILVGVPLEMTNNSWRVAVVYFTGVLLGSLLFSVTNPKTFLMGASAGVMALVSAHLASILLNWKDDSLILRQRMRDRQATNPTFGKIVRIARIALVIGIVGLDVANAVSSKAGDITGYGAHGGGVLAGIFVGIIVLENRRVLYWERWMKGICVGVAAALVVSLIIFNIGAPEGVYPVQEFT